MDSPAPRPWLLWLLGLVSVLETLVSLLNLRSSFRGVIKAPWRGFFSWLSHAVYLLLMLALWVELGRCVGAARCGWQAQSWGEVAGWGLCVVVLVPLSLWVWLLDALDNLSWKY